MLLQVIPPVDSGGIFPLLLVIQEASLKCVVGVRLAGLEFGYRTSTGREPAVLIRPRVGPPLSIRKARRSDLSWLLGSLAVDGERDLVLNGAAIRNCRPLTHYNRCRAGYRVSGVFARPTGFAESATSVLGGFPFNCHRSALRCR